MTLKYGLKIDAKMWSKNNKIYQLNGSGKLITTQFICQLFLIYRDAISTIGFFKNYIITNWVKLKYFIKWWWVKVNFNNLLIYIILKNGVGNKLSSELFI
jgi:hypothetical protein